MSMTGPRRAGHTAGILHWGVTGEVISRVGQVRGNISRRKREENVLVFDVEPEYRNIQPWERGFLDI